LFAIAQSGVENNEMVGHAVSLKNQKHKMQNGGAGFPGPPSLKLQSGEC
jgi:hypothetical protein